jgi:uncharacterized protein YjiK
MPTTFRTSAFPASATCIEPLTGSESYINKRFKRVKRYILPDNSTGITFSIDPSNSSHYNALTGSNCCNLILTDYNLTDCFSVSSVAEASSVCYNPISGNYLVLGSSSDVKIHEFNFNSSSQLRETELDLSSFSDYSDVEGICSVSGTTFAVCSEYRSGGKKNGILLFDYTGSDSVSSISSFTAYDTGITTLHNKGLEGISYNANTNTFYVVTEGDDSPQEDWGVYEIILGVAPATTSTQLFSLSSITTWSSKPESISDIFYHSGLNNLFLLDHGTSGGSDTAKVWQCSLSGDYIDSIDLKKGDGNAAHQLEGICLSPDKSQLVVVGETSSDTPSDICYYSTP